MTNPKELKPTSSLNIVIALTSYVVAIGCLVAANRAESIWLALVFAFLFSLVGNTIFALLHESVHRIFSSDRRVNNFFGRVSAAFFPTSFTLQRGFHLGHHRRNRTDAEMFDMYYERDNKIVKYFQWYTIFTGFYWLSTPFAALMYLLWPGFFQLPFFKKSTRFGYQTGAEAMFSSLERETSPGTARLEVLFALLFQVGLFMIFGLSWQRWLLCYWIFGMNWGALQYADHAWSPRDIRKGAWNLKVSPITRWIFLNYHYHQVHHIHPTLPWYYLPRFINPNEPMPSFLKIYFEMWKGPKLATEPNPQALDEAFIKEMEA